MARLPQVGGDSGNWGEILNDFLSQSLADDGSLKIDSVGAPQLKPNSVTNAAIAPATIAEDRLASDVQAKLNASISPEDLDAKADITYVDDSIANIPAAPVQSVNGQTGAVTVTVDKNAVGLGNVDNTSDNAKPLSAATQTALDGKVNANASTDNRIARFDGTVGQIQNSTVQIDDSGNMSLTSATSGTRRQIAGGNGGSVSFGINGLNLNSFNETAINFDTSNSGTGTLQVYKGATNEAGTKLAEIDNGGRLKVNTNSSLAKLNVQADNTNAEYIALFTENGVTPENSAVIGGMGRMVSVQGLNGAYFMGRDVTTDIEFIMGTSNVGRVFLGSTTGHDLDFRTANSTRMFIQHPTGNVGIGTVMPNEKLVVAGNIASTGTVNGRNIAADATKIENHGMGVVAHGTNAGAARPSGFASVTWIGSSQPTNAVANDVWLYRA